MFFFYYYYMLFNHTLCYKQYCLLLNMNLVILTAAELNYHIPGLSVVDPP